MEQNKSTFPYIALNQTRPEVRIIQIDPDHNPEAPIHCEMFHIFLDCERVQDYFALSYAWGDPNITSTIYLHGWPFNVTANLVTFLKSIRKADKSLPVWVDAVCINQNDDKERGRQITLMGKVYKSALRVYLWTNTLESDIKDALPYLTYRYKFTGEFQEAYNFTKQLRAILPDDPKEREKIMLQVITVIFESSVWQRMWIIQEMVLATATHIICGVTHIRWRTLSYLAIILQRGEDGTIFETRDVGMQGIRILRSIFMYWRKSNVYTGSRDLLRAWYYFGECQCSNPLDKVYSLLNIVQDDLDIVPDYGTSIVELYTKVTRNYILASQSLLILGAKLNRAPREGETDEAYAKRVQEQGGVDLPSWALDFRQSGSIGTAIIFIDRFIVVNDDPDVPFNQQSLDLLRSPRDLMFLDLLGIIVDKISFVFKGPCNLTTLSELLHELMNESKLIVKMVCGHKGYKYQSKKAVEDAYWKTMLANRFSPVPVGDIDIAEIGRVDIRHDAAGLWRRGLDGWIDTIQEDNSKTGSVSLKCKSFLQNILRKPKVSTQQIDPQKQPDPLSKVSPDFPHRPLLRDHIAQQREVQEKIKNIPISEQEILNFQSNVRVSADGFCFGLTAGGRFTLVPDNSEPGDLICGFRGGFGPYVLHPWMGPESQLVYHVLGPAYVHELDLAEEWQNRPEGSEGLFKVS